MNEVLKEWGTEINIYKEINKSAWEKLKWLLPYITNSEFLPAGEFHEIREYIRQLVAKKIFANKELPPGLLCEFGRRPAASGCHWRIDTGTFK